MLHELEIKTNPQPQILINSIRRRRFPAEEPAHPQLTYQILQTVLLNRRHVRNRRAFLILTFFLSRLLWLLAKLHDVLIVFVPVLWELCFHMGCVLMLSLGRFFGGLLILVALMDFLDWVQGLDVVLLELLKGLLLADVVLGKVLVDVCVKQFG